MGAKRKAVFTAEPEQLDRIQEFVREGRYRSSSEFLREAIDEKLERLRGDLLAEQVARYCEKRYADEDEGLIARQAFDEEK
ncbi:MAG TPA: ribbon-helix-helix domain-containing protein [Thermoanaerobaculia bacterium]